MSEWAIDFETANADRGSACSVGAVEIVDGALGRQVYNLVKPAPFVFSEWNVRVHGIGPQQVERAPDFSEVWLRADIRADLFLAHNATFDADVLRRCLLRAGVPLPTVGFVCTIDLARAAFPGLRSYSLPLVAAYLGLSLDHHHAISDAVACAQIGIAAAAAVGAASVLEAAAVYGVPVRPLFGAWEVSEDVVMLPTTPRPPEVTPLPRPTKRIDGLRIAITGQLLLCPREDAIRLIGDAGGIFHPNVRKDTDWLVVGAAPGAKVDTAHARKAKYGKPELTDETGFRLLLGL